MCKGESTNRFEARRAVRHPWITRCANSSIPETLVESYCKIDITNKFKKILGCLVAMQVYKSANVNLFSLIKASKSQSHSQYNSQMSNSSKIINTNSSCEDKEKEMGRA